MTRRLALRVCGIAAALAAQPAAAITFEFYEGNNCRQKMVGAYNYLPLGTGRRDQGTNITAALRGNNDEARSLKVSTSLPRVTDVNGVNLQIYDSPSSKRDDDFVVLYITDPRQIPAQGLCINSFERNFDRNGVFMWRQPRNGLDGKVSSLILQCDTCRPVYSAADQAEIDRRARERSEEERRGQEALEKRQRDEQAAKLRKWRREMIQLDAMKMQTVRSPIKPSK